MLVYIFVMHMSYMMCPPIVRSLKENEKDVKYVLEHKNRKYTIKINK